MEQESADGGHICSAMNYRCMSVNTGDLTLVSAASTYLSICFRHILVALLSAVAHITM